MLSQVTQYIQRKYNTEMLIRFSIHLGMSADWKWSSSLFPQSWNHAYTKWLRAHTYKGKTALCPCFLGVLGNYPVFLVPEKRRDFQLQMNSRGKKRNFVQHILQVCKWSHFIRLTSLYLQPMSYSLRQLGLLIRFLVYPFSRTQESTLT